VFYIYGDDSGKFKNQGDDYTSLCGYVGHISEWARFGLEWNNCRTRWQVPPIHMREIMFGKRRWQEVRARWGTEWEAKRRDMLIDFASIVKDSSLACVGAVVDAAHYRGLPQSEFKEGMPDSVHLAFHMLVMRGIEKTEITDNCSPVGIVIDDDKDSYQFCYQVLDALKDKFEKVRRVKSISFANDDFFPGLQASDMIAYEARKLMQNSQGKQPESVEGIPELYSLLTFFGIHQPKRYTPEVLDRLNSKPLKQEME